ncbi:MAG: hypothetical protein WKF61_05135 [Luteimonas sp.]
MKKLFWIAVVIALLVFGKRWMDGDTSLSLVTVDVKNPYPSSSPLHAASQRFVDGINGDPRLKSRYSGVFTQRGLYADIKTALARGAKSLDGPVLVGATTALSRSLPHLDTHSCAQVFRERDTFDKALSARMKTALEQIPPAHHAALMDFYLKALVAEADNAPERPVDQAQLKSALTNLGQQYQGRFAQRFADAMGNPANAADEDLCWAGTTLLHGITLMGPNDRQVLSRWGIAGE